MAQSSEDLGDFQATGVVVKKKINTKKFKSSVKQTKAIDKNKFSIFGEVLDKKKKQGAAGDDDDDLETDLTQWVRLKKTSLKTAKSIDEKPQKKLSLGPLKKEEPVQEIEPAEEPVQEIEPVEEPIPNEEELPEEPIAKEEELPEDAITEWSNSISDDTSIGKSPVPKKKLLLKKQLSQKAKPEVRKRLPGALDPKKISKFGSGSGSGSGDRRRGSSASSSTGEDIGSFSLKSSSASSIEDQVIGSFSKDRRKEFVDGKRNFSNDSNDEKTASIKESHADQDLPEKLELPMKIQENASQQKEDFKSARTAIEPQQQGQDSGPSARPVAEPEEEKSRVIRSSNKTEKPKVGKLEVKIPAEKTVRKKEGKKPGSLDIRKLGRYNSKLDERKSKFNKGSFQQSSTEQEWGKRQRRDEEDFDVDDEEEEETFSKQTINAKENEEALDGALDVNEGVTGMSSTDAVNSDADGDNDNNMDDDYHSNDEESDTDKLSGDEVTCEDDISDEENEVDSIHYGRRKPYSEYDEDNIQRRTNFRDKTLETEDGIPVDENMINLLQYLAEQEQNPVKKKQILDKIERINSKLSSNEESDGNEYQKKRQNIGDQEFKGRKNFDDQEYRKKTKYQYGSDDETDDVTDSNKRNPENSDAQLLRRRENLEQQREYKRDGRYEYDSDTSDQKNYSNSADSESMSNQKRVRQRDMEEQIYTRRLYKSDNDVSEEKINSDDTSASKHDSLTYVSTDGKTQNDNVRSENQDSQLDSGNSSLRSIKVSRNDDIDRSGRNDKIDRKNTNQDSYQENENRNSIDEYTLPSERSRSSNTCLLASTKGLKNPSHLYQSELSNQGGDLYPIRESDNEESIDPNMSRKSKEVFLEELKKRRRRLLDDLKGSSHQDTTKYSKKHVQIEDIEETRMKNELQKLKRRRSNFQTTGRYDWMILAAGEQIPACKKRGNLNHIIFWVDVENNDDQLKEEQWLLISRGYQDDDTASTKWFSKAQGSDVMSGKTENFKKFRSWSMEMEDTEFDNLESTVGFNCKDRKLWDRKYMPIAKREIFRIVHNDELTLNCSMVFHPGKRYRYEEKVHRNEDAIVFDHITYVIRNVSQYLHVRSCHIENSIFKAIVRS